MHRGNLGVSIADQSEQSELPQLRFESVQEVLTVEIKFPCRRVHCEFFELERGSVGLGQNGLTDNSAPAAFGSQFPSDLHSSLVGRDDSEEIPDVGAILDLKLTGPGPQAERRECALGGVVGIGHLFRSIRQGFPSQSNQAGKKPDLKRLGGRRVARPQTAEEVGHRPAWVGGNFVSVHDGQDIG